MAPKSIILIKIRVCILSFLLRVLGCAARLGLRSRKKSRHIVQNWNWKGGSRINEAKKERHVSCDHLSVYTQKQVDSVRYLANVMQNLSRLSPTSPSHCQLSPQLGE